MDLTDRFALNMITKPTNRQLMPNFFGDLDESSTATPKKERSESEYTPEPQHSSYAITQPNSLFKQWEGQFRPNIGKTFSAIHPKEHSDILLNLQPELDELYEFLGKTYSTESLTIKMQPTRLKTGKIIKPEENQSCGCFFKAPNAESKLYKKFNKIKIMVNLVEKFSF